MFNNPTRTYYISNKPRLNEEHLSPYEKRKDIIIVLLHDNADDDTYVSEDSLSASRETDKTEITDCAKDWGQFDVISLQDKSHMIENFHQ